jgi:DNA-binding HxlR family transcriptional regulator
VAGTAPTPTLEAPTVHGSLQTPGADKAAGVCPYFHEAIELLGKRWSGAIVHTLLSGPKRFSELTHTIPQISDRLLSIRLRELEACGIVGREVYERAPVRVEYQLTPKGRALEPAVKAIRSWACEWLQD